MKYIGVKIVEAESMKRGVASERLHRPIEGDPNTDGYLVTYRTGGYASWCPKCTFERHNRPTSGMPFGHAIEAARQGHKIARRGWNGKGIFLEIQVPDEHSKMTHPYLYIDTTGLQTDNLDAPKDRVPWLSSQSDMLADDWFIAE